MNLSKLIRDYQTDKVSGFRKLRPATRENYIRLCNRIDFDKGEIDLRSVKYRDLVAWHQDWSEDGNKVAMGHALVGMLRTLIGFGATILEDAQCERLCGVLHRMRCPMPKPRTERLTADQATAIRAEAHRRGLHSIALAQAIQFECMFRQKDVIGEWVHRSEKGTSEVLDENGRKWLRGIRWSEIDGKLVLRHVTSKRQKPIEVDLHNSPMVLEEIDRIGAIPAAGPIVVCELTGLPYQSHRFRATWRDIADACGIPKSVKNMDTRAGAISEATDAGADLESVRHAATHSNITTTQNYSRGSADKVRSVQQRRIAHRTRQVPQRDAS